MPFNDDLPFSISMLISSNDQGRKRYPLPSSISGGSFETRIEKKYLQQEALFFSHGLMPLQQVFCLD
jgi:hypothetical protein